MTEPEFVPPDVVPRGQVSREALLLFNAAAANENIVVYLPGELVEDVDGMPAGVTEAEFRHARIAGRTFALSAVVAAGLTPADLPNLNIIDTDKENQ